MSKKLKFIGWAGWVEGKVYFDLEHDNYCEPEATMRTAQMFRSCKEAKKRFEAVVKVYCEQGPHLAG